MRHLPAPLAPDDVSPRMVVFVNGRPVLAELPSVMALSLCTFGEPGDQLIADLDEGDTVADVAAALTCPRCAALWAWETDLAEVPE